MVVVDETKQYKEPSNITRGCLDDVSSRVRKSTAKKKDGEDSVSGREGERERGGGGSSLEFHARQMTNLAKKEIV